MKYDGGHEDNVRNIWIISVIFGDMLMHLVIWILRTIFSPTEINSFVSHV